MSAQRTKSLAAIEDRLGQVEEGSLREKLLKAARYFKISWIELGRLLYEVWRKKAFKEWGYLTFEGYVTKEIGIRHQTATKLLKSYLFLEREEPTYIRQDALAEEARNLEDSGKLPQTRIPSYEAVGILRRAKGKVGEVEYQDLKREVFEEGKDDKDLKNKFQLMIREKNPPDAGRMRSQRRNLVLGRLVHTMKVVAQEAEAAKFLPKGILKELADLAIKIEQELSR